MNPFLQKQIKSSVLITFFSEIDPHGKKDGEVQPPPPCLSIVGNILAENKILKQIL